MLGAEQCRCCRLLFTIQRVFFASFTAVAVGIHPDTKSEKNKLMNRPLSLFLSWALLLGEKLINNANTVDAQLLQSYLWHLFILTRNFPWDLLHLRLSFLFDTKSAFFASNQEKKNKLLPQYSRDLKVCKNQVEIILTK